MNYAYVRVSTEQQSVASQKFEISKWTKAQKIHIDKWISEEISGTVPIEKRKLGEVIRKMQPEDLLICTEISRLGRSILMIMSVLNECSQRSIRIHTIKDNFDLSTTINSKIIAFAFALAAEIERNLISQRTKEALAEKKASGVVLGRPYGSYKKKKEVEENLEAILEERRNGVTIKELAKKYGIHPNTLSRYLNELVY